MTTDPASHPVTPGTASAPDSFAWHRRIVERRVNSIVSGLLDLATTVEQRRLDLDRVLKTPTEEKDYGYELYSYAKIAGRVQHDLITCLANLGLDRLTQVAAEADVARHIEAVQRGEATSRPSTRG